MNGPANTVVSGPEDAVTAYEETMNGRGVITRRLRSRHAFHSPMMAPAREELAKELADLDWSLPRIPLLSDLDGRPMDASNPPDAAYWQRHLEKTVRYAQGMRRLAALGCTSFVEVGPHPVLINSVRKDVEGAVWLPPCDATRTTGRCWPAARPVCTSPGGPWTGRDSTPITRTTAPRFPPIPSSTRTTGCPR